MTTAARGWYAVNDLAARRVMERMRTNVRQSLTDRRVWGTAHRIAADVPERDTAGLARAVRQYVADHLHFLRDPSGVELLQTPARLLDQIARHGAVLGDCDDAATLAAALGLALALPATFAAFAFGAPDAPYSHVVTYLKAGDGWLDVDTTRPAQMLPPHWSRRLLLTV